MRVMEFPKDVWEHILGYADDRVERRAAKSRKRLIREITYKSFSWRRYVGCLNNFIIRSMARRIAIMPHASQPAGIWYNLILRDLANPPRGGSVYDVHLCDLKFVRFLRETKSFKRNIPVHRWRSHRNPEGAQINLAELSSTCIPLSTEVISLDTDSESDSD